MTAWYAYPDAHDANPRGHVEQVAVLHEEGDGTAIVKHAYGHVSTVCGPFCPGRLFDSEAEGWDYCARVLATAAGRLEQAASDCREKAVEVAA